MTTVAGLDFDALSEEQVVARITADLAEGRGGWVVTPNVDICRRARRDPASSRHSGAEPRSSFLTGRRCCGRRGWAGRPLAERVTGADLIFSLSEVAAENAWPVFLLGGTGRGGHAARRPPGGVPGLGWRGATSRRSGLTRSPTTSPTCGRLLVRAGPRLVFVGLGFPKQEQLIARPPGCPAPGSSAAGQRFRSPRGAAPGAGVDAARRP